MGLLCGWRDGTHAPTQLLVASSCVLVLVGSLQSSITTHNNDTYIHMYMYPYLERRRRLPVAAAAAANYRTVLQHLSIH